MRIGLRAHAHFALEADQLPCRAFRRSCCGYLLGAGLARSLDGQVLDALGRDDFAPASVARRTVCVRIRSASLQEAGVPRIRAACPAGRGLGRHCRRTRRSDRRRRSFVASRQTQQPGGNGRLARSAATMRFMKTLSRKACLAFFKKCTGSSGPCRLPGGKLFANRRAARRPAELFAANRLAAAPSPVFRCYITVIGLRLRRASTAKQEAQGNRRRSTAKRVSEGQRPCRPLNAAAFRMWRA